MLAVFFPIAFLGWPYFSRKIVGSRFLIGNFFPWKILGHFDFTDETANLGD